MNSGSKTTALLMRAAALVAAACCAVSGTLMTAHGAAPSTEAVITEARKALPAWVARATPAQLGELGLGTAGAIERAIALPPIPLLYPSVDRSALTRSSLEAAVATGPVPLWMVPVAVDGSAVCALIVASERDHPVRVTEFGRPFAARRLQAGLTALGLSAPDTWPPLHLVSFVAPTIDVLLAQAPDGTWRWVNLTGTTTPTAAVLDTAGVEALIDRLRSTATAGSS